MAVSITIKILLLYTNTVGITCSQKTMHPFVLATIFYRVQSASARTFYIENDAEIFPAHYRWKVAEEGFKMVFMMNKLAMVNSCEIIFEK